MAAPQLRCAHALSVQVEVGIYAAKRVANCFKKLCEMEEEYAKNIQKVLAHENAKMAKLDGDNMRIFQQV